MHGPSRLWVDGNYTDLPTGGCITKSHLGHYIMSLTGGRMTTVAYGWTVTILSRLQVDDQKGDEAPKFSHLN